MSARIPPGSVGLATRTLGAHPHPNNWPSSPCCSVSLNIPGDCYHRGYKAVHFNPVQKLVVTRQTGKPHMLNTDGGLRYTDKWHIWSAFSTRASHTFDSFVHIHEDIVRMQLKYRVQK